jgi:hypothetical protein
VSRAGPVLIGAMATMTLLGSISGLIGYAEKGDPGALHFGSFGVPTGTLAFVAGLDGLAISLTLLAHRHGSTDWSAFGGLVVVTGISTALQVAAVWGAGTTAVIVHGSPAPCTAVAAFYLLRSLGAHHGPASSPEAGLPAPPMGAVSVDGSTPAPTAEATALAPPVTGAPLEAGPLAQRRTSRATPSRPSKGKREGSRLPSAGSPPVKGDDLVRQAAQWLMKNDRKLTAVNVQAAVRAINGTCSKDTRTTVYAALTLEEAMTSATGPDQESD